MSIKNAGGIGNGFFSVIIGNVGIFANLGDEQPVGFHGGDRLFRKSAGGRVGAFRTDPAAAGSQTEGIGMFFPNLFAETCEIFQMQFLRLPIGFGIDGLA